MNALIAVVLAVVVFFGGSGVTVYAAQDSLPDQTLYPVKTWSEDAMLSLTGSALVRLDYVLNFSDRRVVEIEGLLAAGKPIPVGVEIRFQNQLNLALDLVAGMDDAQALQQLQQVQQRAEAQYQKMVDADVWSSRIRRNHCSCGHVHFFKNKSDWPAWARRICRGSACRSGSVSRYKGG